MSFQSPNRSRTSGTSVSSNSQERKRHVFGHSCLVLTALVVVISITAYGGEAPAIAAEAAPAVAPAAGKLPPAPSKSAILLDLPPVSAESIQSLMDYLGAQLIHAMDYRVSDDVSKVPPAERGL